MWLIKSLKWTFPKKMFPLARPLTDPRDTDANISFKDMSEF